VSSPDARNLPWMWSVCALGVAMFLLAAAVGCGLAPVNRAVSVSSQPALTCLDIANADDESTYHYVDQVSSHAIDKAFHVAVRHRARPLTWSPSTQSSWSSPMPSLPASRYRLGVAGSCAPVNALAGRERLTQFCVARN
jgi:hypothetical protein